MKRLGTTLGAMLCMGALLTAEDCSTEHVESMKSMNEGVALAGQGRTVEAIEHLQRATAIEPSNHEAFANLCMVHMQEQKFEAARDDIQKAIAAAPTSAGYQEKLGTILIELQNWEGAKTALTKAIELDPNLFKAYYKLARVHEHLAQDEEGNANLQAALNRYSESIQKGPRFLEAYNALGRLYADLGYFDQSVQVLRSAMNVAMPGTSEAALAHHLLGTVLQQQNKLAEAITEFRAALDIDPAMTDALFSIGWAYGDQGNREESARYLRKFIDLGSSSAPRHYIKAAQDRVTEYSETH